MRRSARANEAAASERPPQKLSVCTMGERGEKKKKETKERKKGKKGEGPATGLIGGNSSH